MWLFWEPVTVVQGSQCCAKSYCVTQFLPCAVVLIWYKSVRQQPFKLLGCQFLVSSISGAWLPGTVVIAAVNNMIYCKLYYLYFKQFSKIDLKMPGCTKLILSCLLKVLHFHCLSLSLLSTCICNFVLVNYLYYNLLPITQHCHRGFLFECRALKSNTRQWKQSECSVLRHDQTSEQHQNTTI